MPTAEEEKATMINAVKRAGKPNELSVKSEEEAKERKESNWTPTGKIERAPPSPYTSGRIAQSSTKGEKFNLLIQIRIERRIGSISSAAGATHGRDDDGKSGGDSKKAKS